ncbi:NAD-dependent epimerase/dehydratase family protein [candidate division KSB3 bacterium]|uniref:NAD-dependent epimerase/dehydratase family protein n=1 Tax=candidate division KSB3 bacterium TaxID=2044937 RepID=A0A9D5Q5G9_9BACT|nr:NAD-dependent epimerase/dehydratase family protein [candidate division KSB3 bacterium]MBD3324222.1 NAD-dependent epimerase/dehydratase family protein [candidate division KSB3 bacterium]
MTIGITGHKGFIGSAVAQHVAQQNCHVLTLDRLTRSPEGERQDAKEYPDNLDWVLHFGASTSISQSFDHPFATYQNNLNATLSALQIAQYSKASFLYMSSYVYGTPQYLPIDETHPLGCSNPYMGSKILGEQLCQQCNMLFHVPVVILRGFYIYGPALPPGRFISDLLACVRRGTPITINDPSPKRDYLYIRDFCALIWRILSQTPLKTGIYNVGYGQSYSNLDVAELLRTLSHEHRPIVINSVRRQNDIGDCIPDVSMVKQTFSWEPVYSLEMGLRELLTMPQKSS